MPKKNIAEMRKIKREEQRKADNRFTWRVLGVMLFLALWTFLIYRFEWSVYLFAIPSGIAVIYLLAYIYPKDFTALAVLVSGGAFGLWLLTVLYQRSGRLNLLAHTIFAASIAVAVLLIWLTRRAGGVWKLGKLSVRIMPARARYRYMFIACGALAVSLAVSVLFGGTAAWCAFIAMLCYLFVMAVYYTVKLI